MRRRAFVAIPLFALIAAAGISTGGASRPGPRIEVAVAPGWVPPEWQDSPPVAPPDAPAPVMAPDSPPPVYGATGPAVAEFQAGLAARGFDPGPIDGRFGVLTAAAARASGLTVDAPPPPPVPVPAPRTAPSPAGLEPCGGAYPPCSVAAAESGGRYDAYNPTGCTSQGRAGCYGKWQFGWFWGGKLGLPLDLATATPAQQDEAARILWNGGAGCSNWNAC